MIGSTISHYRILEKLGEGGMGVVYRAQDTKLDRVVALKFLPSHLAGSEQDKARFILEAKAAATLNHPNICTIHDIQDHDGQMFIVMEFVEGQTLRERTNSQVINLKSAIEIGIQIAEGLSAAHEKGIVHRDIKPENIMIRKDGIPQIMDFGLAKLRSTGSTISRLTKQGSTVGTAGYMSPEQVQGQDADHRSDIFSLGVLLYEMLTGKLPFKGVHETALAYEIVNVDAPPMSSVRPELDPALDAIVLECLEKDPNERSQSTKQVAVDLKKYRRESSQQRISRVTATRHTFPSLPGEERPHTQSAGTRKILVPWLIAGIALILAAAMAIAHFDTVETAAPMIRSHLLPEVHTAVTQFGSLAISADGSMLAYVAYDSFDNVQLWVRPLKSANAIPLPGTEGAQFPFWSPDNRHIGFFAARKLKKVEAGGGLVTTLCEVQNPSGGSWNNQNVIIFTSFGEDGIFRIPAQGGTPLRLPSADTTNGETACSSPWFLPDGKHFLYTTNTKLMVVARTEANAVFLGSIDSDTRRRLIPSSSNAMTANGYIIFMRDNTLVAQKFEEGTMTVAGDPATVAEQVQYANRWGKGEFSVSQSGLLVYQSRISNLTGSLMIYDRTGKVLQSVGKVASYDDPVLSPDGSRLAFTLYEGSGSRGDVWITEFSRGTISRFTFDTSEEDDPVWTPDGMNIVFSQVGDLVMKPSSGIGEPQVLYSSKTDKVPTDISPDGKFLIYGDFGAKTGRDIWVLPVTGEKTPIPVAVTEFNEVVGQFSPDGRWIAYSSNETGRQEVYIRSFPSSAGRWQISTHGGIHPQWDEGGQQLYYIDPNNQLMIVGVKSLGSSVQAGTPSILFKTRNSYGGGPGHRYDVSGDGQRIILVDEQEGEFRSEPLNLIVNWPSDLAGSNTR